MRNLGEQKQQPYTVIAFDFSFIKNAGLALVISPDASAT